MLLFVQIFKIKLLCCKLNLWKWWNVEIYSRKKRQRKKWFAGAKKAEKVLVFGFSRLCKYVFELTGNLADNVIDEGTRAVVMSLALEELTEKLRLLSSKGNKSLVDVMLQTVSDLKKSSVTSDELRSASMLVCDETLKTKLPHKRYIRRSCQPKLYWSYGWLDKA